MKKYDVIFFDLDGTLTNPERGLVSSFAYGLSKMGVSYGERSRLKKYIGPPLREIWQTDYGFSPEEAEEAVRLFREYFSVYGWWDNELYDGIHEMLMLIKASGRRIALATSKPEIFAKKILALFDLTKYFDFVGGATNDKSRDQKWQVLEYGILSLGNPDRSGCILVGDRKYDAEGAQICGIDSIGVLYGHGSEEEVNSAGFTYVLKTPKDVAELLK